MIVAALVRDPVSKARLSDALRTEASVRYCDRLTEVLTLVEAGLASLIVVDHRDFDGSPTLPAVRRLHEAYPSVPIVMYLPMSAAVSGAVMEYARAGVSQLVFQGVDDLKPALRSAVDAAIDQASAAALAEQFEPHIPAAVMPFLRYCLEHARRDISVEEVAAAMGVHRKTLVERLRAARLPSPRTMIGWSRLLIASRMLDDPGRTIEQVALKLDFPSGAALRNMFKRYTGLRTSEVRQNGGVRCLVHAFRRELTSASARSPGA
ncbi:MAG TPA: helix-turn-helix domain-containing protein [Gemmatimonadaceae bacterium]